MKTFFLTFRSITQAQRAERAFARAGMAVVLRRTPRWMEERGCGYCLRLRGSAWRAALAILDRAGVEYRKVYRLAGEKGEEVPV